MNVYNHLKGIDKNSIFILLCSRIPLEHPALKNNNYIQKRLNIRGWFYNKQYIVVGGARWYSSDVLKINSIANNSNLTINQKSNVENTLKSTIENKVFKLNKIFYTFNVKIIRIT